MTANDFKRQVDACHRKSDLDALLNVAFAVIEATAVDRNAAIEYAVVARGRFVEAAADLSVVSVGLAGASGL